MTPATWRVSVTTRSAVSFPGVDLVFDFVIDDPVVDPVVDPVALSFLRRKVGDPIMEAVPFPIDFVSFTAPTK